MLLYWLSLRHIVLWIAFTCGAITSTQGRHLPFTIGYQRITGRAKTWSGIPAGRFSIDDFLMDLTRIFTVIDALISL